MKTENKQKNNPELDLAWKFLEQTGTNIFLTGRAGTGKTSFLHQLKEHSPKRMIVVAPTGVAAINAGGLTIHSFFQLPFGPYIPALQKGEGGRMKRFFNKEKIAIIKSLDLLVIDEISMVRADLLDAIDDVLQRYRVRNKAFGGVQLLMIGDLQQLAPVLKPEEWDLIRHHYSSPYFFDSKALQSTEYIRLELQHIYRQSDSDFIEILNKIRDNNLDSTTLKKLNTRYIANFNPQDSEAYITLTSHNEAARRINETKLQALHKPAYTFKCTIEGNFPEYLYPNSKDLCLKEGAQVMFLKNDVSGLQRYYNGKIGRISHINEENIEVLLDDNTEPIQVEIGEWSHVKYTIDHQTQEIKETIEGVFRQFPLKPAWAITIHKSQGLSFDRAIIDAADSFSHGQVYVALSRCRSFEGLVLRSPLTSSAIINDDQVKAYSMQIQKNQPDENVLRIQSRRYYQSILMELFDFVPIKIRLMVVQKIFYQALYKIYPKLTEEWDVIMNRFQTEVLCVSEKFLRQIDRFFLSEVDPNNPRDFMERLAKARIYFQRKCEEIILPIFSKSMLTIDNKDVRKQFFDALEKLNEVLSVKLAVLKTDEQEAFSISSYLKAKAKVSLNIPKLKKTKAERIEKIVLRTEIEDIDKPELFEILKTWRKKVADQSGVPVYVILKQTALLQISKQLPKTNKDLLSTKGIGKVFVSRYAEEVLAMIRDFESTRY